MRFLVLCFLITAMLPIAGSAQSPGLAQPAGISYDLWLVRSHSITEDVIKDATVLTPSARALLWARLAQQWWRDDPEKARSWMLKPFEIVETVPNRENPDERSQRLATVRSLLSIVAPLDQKLSKRLVAILNHESEQAADADRNANADGLVEAAIALSDQDPQRAAEMGAAALRLGRTTMIASLLWKLRPSSPKLADALFAQTLAVVRQSLDPELLNSLTQVAFPSSMQPGAHTAAPPDNLRTELLKLDAGYLQANPITAENRASICMSVVSFVAPVLPQFDRLLPQQAAIVRQSVNQCQSMSPLAQQRVDDALRDQPLNTVDALLKAGDDAQDVHARTVYQYRAAALAKQQDDFDRALRILDSMSIESREFMGGSWEAYRWGWAAVSASRHFKNGDVYGMRSIINAVPTDLQAFAKIEFVRQLPETRDKDIDPTLEFLNDARKGLSRSAIPDAEKTGWYFALLRLTVKFQPNSAMDVLKEAVAVLNSAEETEQKNNQPARVRFDGAEFSGNLSAALLELNEFAVREAISSIASTETRVQVRLELLGGCLERLRSSKQNAPNQKRTT